MSNVLELFLAARQQHTSSPLKVVDVKVVGGGKPNDCFGNACDVIDTNEDYLAVSGWIVQPFNPFKKHAEIVQHWWNIDVNTREHFDTTPSLDIIECVYVVDREVMKYGQAHYDEIDSNVCSSLMLKEDGTFVLVDDVNGQLVYSDVDKLSIENLFRNSMIKK